MPVRGFGAKNVVFSGMRTPAAAAARIVSTSTGRRSTAGLGLTLLDRRRHGGGVVAVPEGDPGHRREHAGFEPRRVDAAQRRGSARRRGRRARPSARATPGRRRRRGRARPRAASPPRARPRPPPRWGRRRVPRRPGASASRSRTEPRSCKQPVDGAHAELLGCELHDQGHDRSRPGVVGAPLVAVGARGLEAVMAVGQHEARTPRPPPRSRPAVPDR